MQRIRILLGLWLLASLVFIGSVDTCWAGPAKRTVTNVDSIRRFMEKGQALFAAGQFQRAAEVFEAGYDLHPYSAFLFNAGVALERSGRLLEAIGIFERYTAVDPTAPDAADVRERIVKIRQTLEEQERNKTRGIDVSTPGLPAAADSVTTKSVVIIETEPPVAPLRILRRIRGESSFDPSGNNPDWQAVLSTKSPANLSLDVGQYHVEIQRFDDYNRGDSSFDVQPGHVIQVKVALSQGEFMGHVRVTSNVPSARVYLDDLSGKRDPAGKTPFGDFLTVGEHSIRVTASGYTPLLQRFSLDHGQHLDLRANLQRLPHGSLRISSNVVGAEVTLDGVAVGSVVSTSTPLALKEIKAGAHHLRIKAVGRKPLEADVQVPRGQALPVHARLVVTPPRGAAYTQAIIGGVLLGAGIFFGVESNQTYNDMSTDRNDGSLASDDPRRTRGKLYAIGADIAFVGAAAMGGLSTYSFLRDPLPPSRLIVRAPVEFDETEAQRGRP